MATSSASAQANPPGLTPVSSKRPSKSILKKHHEHHDKHKGASFDEMNILATYHPADKDYGHMKIDEPKTPYRNDSDGGEGLDVDDVSDRLANASDPTVCRPRRDSARSDEDVDSEQYMSPEERDRVKRFKEHRKEHYNMKEQLMKAKELLAKEMAELEDD